MAGGGDRLSRGARCGERDGGDAPSGWPRPNFGHGGKVIARAPEAVANTAFGAAALASDGDLVVELKREVPEGEPIREIERRLPDGSLDPSFGTKGRVRVGPGKGLGLRADGSILVATESCGRKRGSLLLDPGGNRETGFGEGGCGAAVGFSPDHIVPGPDGRTYLGGSAAICPCGKSAVPRDEPVVARLGADGGLDPGFGKGGVVHLHADLNIPQEAAFDTREADGIVATADGGAVVAAGDLLIGLGPDGSLAADFGVGGQVGLSAFARADPAPGWQAPGRRELCPLVLPRAWARRAGPLPARGRARPGLRQRWHRRTDAVGASDADRIGARPRRNGARGR